MATVLGRRVAWFSIPHPVGRDSYPNGVTGLTRGSPLRVLARPRGFEHRPRRDRILKREPHTAVNGYLLRRGATGSRNKEHRHPHGRQVAEITNRRWRTQVEDGDTFGMLAGFP